MAKKRKIILSAISLIAVIFAGWWFISRREPSFNGRSLSEWADIGLKAMDTTPRDIPNVLLASNAIRQIGAKAVPLAYSWTEEIPAWSEQINQLADRAGWVERLSNDEKRSGYAAFRLRPLERGGFMIYALQEEMASGFENLSRTNQFGPGWVLNSLNDRTLLMFFEQLPQDTNPEVVTAVLREMRASGRNKATFGPALWAYSQTTNSGELHFLALGGLARSGFRAEETA